ncbi:ABC transporter permease subunit [Galbitalea sp. SE-J8]|uniref:ABC transporter permease n=1 Tax=Galbitalea sp. SE-J8 TaxID=3054952 RepID=UPI00259C861C|nr:ABC transporter permease subunit [Galbitalea sp. SE-J8]MDM4762232.1 ABC transporter permease subunit [Galbitalea sp. SE-J8]
MTATSVARIRSLPGAGVAVPIAAAAALLVLWQVAAVTVLAGKGVIAAPSAIIGEIAGRPAVYATAIGATVSIAAIGWLAGNALAIVSALVFVQFRVAERLLLGVAVALVCVPLVAIMPILQIAFDPTTTRIVLAAIAAYFPTLISTMVGLRSADPNQLTMYSSWGASRLQALLGVRVRNALPGLFAGLQVAAPAALLGAILGEFIGARAGLGTLIVTGLFTLDLDMTWAVAVITTAITTTLFWAIGAIGRRLTPWASTMSTGAPPTAAVGGGARRALVGLAFALASIALVLAAWWGFIAGFGLSPFFAKTPLDVLDYLFRSAGAADNRAIIAAGLCTTLVHTFVGYTVGLVVGIVTAIVFVATPPVERAALPVLMMLRSVPLPVLLPLVIIAFGRGLAGVAVITAIVTFFPTLANTAAGLHRTPPDALLLARSYAAGPLSTFWRVRLPFAVPSMLASARIAAPAAVLASTLAEWLATGDGLGHLMVSARASQLFSQLWSAAVVLTVVSVVFYAIVSRAERTVLARFGAA